MDHITTPPSNTVSAPLAKSVTRRDVLKIGGALAAASISIPTILSACSGSSANKTLLVYWSTGHMYDVYKQVVSKFEQDHPGWNVELEPYTWPDMRTKLLANFASGNAVPDLIEEPGGWVQEFGQTGKLHSLQPYIQAGSKSTGFPDDWQPYTVTRNTINNQVYGIQFHLTCVLCIYNQDMFDKAGIKQPPATWDELLSVAQELTHGNIYGIGLNHDSAWAWPWFLQNGVSYYDPKQNVVPMNNEAAYEALQFQADLIHKYKVAPLPLQLATSQGPQQMLSAGRVALTLSGPQDISAILRSSPDLNWNVAPALTRKVHTTSTAGTSLMIPKAAKNPEMAWELVKRLITLDTEIAVTKEAHMTLPRKSWSTNPIVQQTPHVAQFADGLSTAQWHTAELDRTGQSGAISSLFDKAYQDVIYNNVAANQALDQFVAAANKLLQK